MSEAVTSSQISMARRIEEFAESIPTAVATRSIRAEDDVREITWSDLHSRSTQVAETLLKMDVVARPATVLLMTRDSVDHAVGAFGAWKLGLSVLPISPSVGSVEGRQVLKDLERPILVGATVEWAGEEHIPIPDDGGEQPMSDELRAVREKNAVADPMLIIASSGSTGVPKLIDPIGKGAFTPGQFLGGLGNALQREQRRRFLVCSPLNHGAGSVGMYMNLFEGGEVTALARFDPDVVLWAIKEYQIATVGLVPTMMRRILESPNFDRDHLQSLQSMSHTGGICSVEVKQAWIDMLGPEKVTEIYGSTESVGHTVITGTEWLKHKGSQGKPINCDLSIFGPDGEQLGPGQVGEVFVRPLVESVDVEHKYLNPDLKMRTKNGFVSVGDLGYTDDDGYLYVVGRTDDLIITGGANVYPDEVEDAIRALPGVEDCVVVPKPDTDLGQAVHAVVSMTEASEPLTLEMLRAELAGKLSPYKVPRGLDVVAQIDRSDAGKVRRKRYAAEVASGRLG